MFFEKYIGKLKHQNVILLGYVMNVEIIDTKVLLFKVLIFYLRWYMNWLSYTSIV